MAGIEEDTMARIEHLQQYVDDVLEAFHSGSGAAPGKLSQPITLSIAKELIKYEVRRVLLHENPLEPCVYFRLESKPESKPGAILAWTQMMQKLQERWALRFVGARGDEPAVLFATAYGIANPAALVADGITIASQLELHLRDWYVL